MLLGLYAERFLSALRHLLSSTDVDIEFPKFKRELALSAGKRLSSHMDVTP